MTESLLVGLTGGLASGKSTVARLLVERGCEVIDADELVAELYLAGGAGSRAVAEVAGEEMLTPDGAVDRAAVAKRLFADADFRAEIEAAVHPLVRRRFEERVAASDAEIVVLEATLLVEAGYGEVLDTVITVEADAETRFARSVARGLPEGETRARLRAQGDGIERREGADRTLTNDGTLADLERSVDALVAELRGLLQDPAEE